MRNSPEFVSINLETGTLRSSDLILLARAQWEDESRSRIWNAHFGAFAVRYRSPWDFASRFSDV
jgi:hypothetical protein